MAKAKKTSSARSSPARRAAPRSDWCKCPDGITDSFYLPDGVCECGEWKHHYHCERCKGITQVG
jgi:hypothetical protein